VIGLEKSPPGRGDPPQKFHRPKNPGMLIMPSGVDLWAFQGHPSLSPWANPNRRFQAPGEAVSPVTFTSFPMVGGGILGWRGNW
jgi:hypothetical protein